MRPVLAQRCPICQLAGGGHKAQQGFYREKLRPVPVRRNISPRSLLFDNYEVASANYNLKLRNAFANPNNPKLT